MNASTIRHGWESDKGIELNRIGYLVNAYIFCVERHFHWDILPSQITLWILSLDYDTQELAVNFVDFAAASAIRPQSTIYELFKRRILYGISVLVLAQVHL